VTWYTWLEQGRDVKPSTEVLAALADALRLDQAERAYLYQLNDRPPQETRSNEPERIELPLRRMLDSLAGQPAYILGRRWDVLAWNRAAKMLFGDYGELEGDERTSSTWFSPIKRIANFSSIGTSLPRGRSPCSERTSPAMPATRISNVSSEP
jgi:transcriptional regulator with XRE-family HTH domain